MVFVISLFSNVLYSIECMIFLNILLLDIVDIFCIEFRFHETFTDINAVTRILWIEIPNTFRTSKR